MARGRFWFFTHPLVFPSFCLVLVSSCFLCIGSISVFIPKGVHVLYRICSEWCWSDEQNVNDSSRFIMFCSSDSLRYDLFRFVWGFSISRSVWTYMYRICSEWCWLVKEEITWWFILIHHVISVFYLSSPWRIIQSSVFDWLTDQESIIKNKKSRFIMFCSSDSLRYDLSRGFSISRSVWTYMYRICSEWCWSAEQNVNDSSCFVFVFQLPDKLFSRLYLLDWPTTFSCIDSRFWEGPSSSQPHQSVYEYCADQFNFYHLEWICRLESMWMKILGMCQYRTRTL